MDSSSHEAMQNRIKQLETELEEASKKLQNSGIELEANEALLKLAMEDMRRIYEDLLRSKTQVMQSDKLATIGLLSAGVVHEINNPLSAVRLASSLLQTHLSKLRTQEDAAKRKSEADECLSILERMNVCVDSIVKIANDIRVFSRSDKGEVSRLNVNTVIDSVLGVFWNSLKKNVQIVKQYGSVPDMDGNSQQLSQVVLNLVVNASQAIGSDPGTVTICTSAAPGGVEIRIRDTGCGMTDEVKQRLFEPFFTTKGADQGTGLGLSITNDIIKKHKGSISVESQPGKGTEFIITLPASQLT